MTAVVFHGGDLARDTAHRARSAVGTVRPHRPHLFGDPVLRGSPPDVVRFLWSGPRGEPPADALILFSETVYEAHELDDMREAGYVPWEIRPMDAWVPPLDFGPWGTAAAVLMRVGRGVTVFGTDVPPGRNTR